jgi:twitching motility protein PilT
MNKDPKGPHAAKTVPMKPVRPDRVGQRPPKPPPAPPGFKPGAPPPPPGSKPANSLTPSSPPPRIETPVPDRPSARPVQAHVSLSSEPPLPSAPAKHPAQPAGEEDEPFDYQFKIQRGGAMIGSILMDNGFLTDEQRKECLKVQAKSNENPLFGKIAVDLGFVKQKVVDVALKAQRRYVKNVHDEQSRAVHVPAEVIAGTDEPRKRSDPSQLHKWLTSALMHGASNLHLMAGRPLVLRRLGQLVESKTPPLKAEEIEKQIYSVLSNKDIKHLEGERSLVKCIDLPGGGRARCTFFYHLGGLNGVFRLIPAEVPSMVSLNLPQVLGKFTTYPQGMVLVTGPISSGKTTTLASIVQIINEERQDHILTIEKPIEFIIKSKKCLITQREVGRHTDSFANALKGAFREDPDVIVVGEMSDLETTRLTMSAAETGHLVFATLHTQNAIRSINRLLDMFPTEEQSQVLSIVAESLRGVVSQTLVPRCDTTGLIPVVEILVPTPAVRNMIRDRKIHLIKNNMKIGREAGNLLLEDHAAELLQKGIIAKETYEKVRES